MSVGRMCLNVAQLVGSTDLEIARRKHFRHQNDTNSKAHRAKLHGFRPNETNLTKEKSQPA